MSLFAPSACFPEPDPSQGHGGGSFPPPDINWSQRLEFPPLPSQCVRAFQGVHTSQLDLGTKVVTQVRHVRRRWRVRGAGKGCWLEPPRGRGPLRRALSPTPATISNSLSILEPYLRSRWRGGATPPGSTTQEPKMNLGHICNFYSKPLLIAKLMPLFSHRCIVCFFLENRDCICSKLVLSLPMLHFF